MKAYLTKDGVPGKRMFDLPNPRPKSGDIFERTVFARTVGGQDYEVGDTIEMIEMTQESPHGYHCSAGNWRCRTKHGVSVWTSVEEDIARGLWRKIGSVRPVEPREPVKTLWERLDNEPD